jgi:hypothetical protein
LVLLLVFLQEMPEQAQVKSVAPQVYWQIVESARNVRRLFPPAKDSYLQQRIEEYLT